MKVIEYIHPKKKKITKSISKEIVNTFAPYTPKDKWDWGRDSWLYRPLTYLFDDGKNWVWTNTPKLHNNHLLVGIFSYKAKIIKF